MNDTITCEELERFFEDFATELEKGQTVPYALQTLSNQEGNTFFRCIIDEVYESVTYGMTLTDALMRHPSVFDNDIVDAVREGEESGTLTETLCRLGESGN